MNNKKIVLLIPAIIGIMFVLPMISAATTLTSPITNSNYTTTMNLTCTTGIFNATNATFFYNASGGAVYVPLVVVANTSVNQQIFSSPVQSITSLSDLKTYNFSCTVKNLTNSIENSTGVTSITVDNTNPTDGLSLDTASLSTRSVVLVKWAFADATSGLSAYNVTIVSPDASRCPNVVETAVSGEDALVDDQTACPGTYTVTATSTDFAGNKLSTVKTFKAYLAGLNSAGANTLGGNTASSFSQGQEIGSNQPLGNTGTNVAILLILVGALYLFFKKK